MAFFGLLKRKEIFEDKPIIEEERTNMENNVSKTDPIAQMMASIPDGSNESHMKTYDILVFEPQPDGTKKQTTVNGVKAASQIDLARLYAADGAQIQILKEYGTQNNEQKSVEANLEQSKQQMQQQTPSYYQQGTPRPPIQQLSQQKTPPKYFEIGGVKCKLEDGKMFQEQWVKVDASKYRLVADTTNKLVSMNGKHLEVLKWIQIEDKDGETENA